MHWCTGQDCKQERVFTSARGHAWGGGCTSAQGRECKEGCTSARGCALVQSTCACTHRVSVRGASVHAPCACAYAGCTCVPCAVRRHCVHVHCRGCMSLHGARAHAQHGCPCTGSAGVQGVCPHAVSLPAQPSTPCRHPCPYTTHCHGAGHPPACTPALTPSLPAEPPAHMLAEVLFCQPAMPSLGLALTFDADQLFWFDFPRSSWTPRLPDLPSWPPSLEPPTELLHDATLCQDLRRSLTERVTGQLPESKGTCRGGCRGPCPCPPCATTRHVPPLSL